MITKIDTSKSLTKHILCDYNCKFDSRKCNSNQNWNKELCRCESKLKICVITAGIKNISQ